MAAPSPAVAAEGESVGALFRRAKIEQEQGNLEVVWKIYEQLERYPEARDWLLLVRAEQAIEAGDFVLAHRHLGQIGRRSPAWRDALRLRDRMALARPRKLVVSAIQLRDTQPLTSTFLSATLQDALSPAVDAKVEHRIDTLIGADTLQAAGSSIETRVRAGRALLDVESSLRYRAWSDGEELWTGGTALVLLPARPARLRGGWSRTEEIATLSGAARHIVRDTSFLTLSLDWRGWMVQAHGQLHWHSDDNSGHLGSIWALVPLLERGVLLHAGWAGSIRDSRASRWDFASATYQPYFTPLTAYVHGPLFAAQVRADPVEVRGTAAISVSASDQDPTTFGFYELRRSWTDLHLQGSTRVRIPPVTINIEYDHGRQIYYFYHRLQAVLDVQF